MLRAIIRLCLRFPWPTLFVAVGLAAAGGVALFRIDYDVFPNFAPPIVKVYTTAEGFAPRDVESLITTPIEHAIDGVPGLANLRSQSVTGVSVVTASFRSGTDLYRDRELVAERVASVAPQLPANARPVLPPSESAAGIVLDVGLTSNRLSLIQLTELTRSAIEPALLAVPGVASAPIFGAQPLQWQVRANPKALLAAHIGLNQLTAATASSSGIASAGLVRTPNQRFVVQSHGQAADLAELGRTVIPTGAPTPLTIQDVARVAAGSTPPIGGALIGKKRGLLLVITSLYGSNTLTVAHALEVALKRLEPGLAREGVTVDTHALRPTTFIREALRDLRNSLLIGAALILFVLIVSLRNWRIAVISFATIPLTLLVTILVLWAAGQSLNTMSLGGLVVALGSIVDDAVIDVENIRRRLHENQMRPPQPQPPLHVILEASVEVRTPIIFATLAIAVIFLPLFALGGVAGRLFAPLAVAFIAAIITSLIFAVTLTPALSAILLRPSGIAATDPFFVRVTRRLHANVLGSIRRHGRTAVTLFLLFMLAALAGIGTLLILPTSFLPRFHEDEVIAHFLAPPGTSLAESIGLAQLVVGRLQKMPDVAHVVAHIGHANLGHGIGDVNRAEFDVTLSAAGNRHSLESEDAVRTALGTIPGTRFWAGTFLTERIHEVLSGSTAPIIVRVFGAHLAAINADAMRIAGVLRKLHGAEAVAVAAPATTPTVSIVLRRDALVQYHLQPQTVLNAIQTAFIGQEVGRVYRDGTSWPIVVLMESANSNPTNVAQVPLVTRAGEVVTLGQLAEIEEENGSAEILHEDAQRVQNVTVEVSGSTSAFLRRAEKAIATVPLAPGTYFVFRGSAVAGAATQKTLLYFGAAAFAVIMVLLTIALGGLRPAVLLAVNVPFSLLGGIAAIWITGLPLSLGAAVGLVTVFGITLRNGLMLLSHYRHLVIVDQAQWSEETITRGAVERVVPVLLTATVTALGLLALALGAGLPGQEIEGPMAIVIVGGLISSTPLTLFALPSLSYRFLRTQDLAGPPEFA